MGKRFQVWYLFIYFSFKTKVGNYTISITIHTFFTIESLLEFCWSLSIALYIHSYWLLCSWYWRVCIECDWRLFECVSWSVIVHFNVCTYFSRLVIWRLRFLFEWFGVFRGQDFSPSLTVFGRWIGDLCESSFIGGNFLFLKGWFVLMCVFLQTTSLDFSLFVTSFSLCVSLVKFVWFQMDQFLYKISIFLFLIDVIYPPCNRDMNVFSLVGPSYFPCFQEGHIPLVLYFLCFLFFFKTACRIEVTKFGMSFQWDS